MTNDSTSACVFTWGKAFRSYIPMSFRSGVLHSVDIFSSTAHQNRDTVHTYNNINNNKLSGLVLGVVFTFRRRSE